MVLIRKARKEDFLDYFGLRRLFCDFHLKLPDPGVKLDVEIYSKDTERKHFLSYLRKRKGIILVAVDKGVVGYLRANIKINENTSIKYGYIEELYVKKNFRGKKVGKELENEYLSWVKAQKVRWSVLDVSSSNSKAINIYKKIGYLESNKYMVKRC